MKVLKKMINANMIHAEYFSSTQSIAFDQLANIEIMETLDAKFKEWEDQEIDNGVKKKD